MKLLLKSGFLQGTAPVPGIKYRVPDASDTDLRLCKFFGLSNGYWLRAQVAHDTEVAERQMGALLKKIRPYTDVLA